LKLKVHYTPGDGKGWALDEDLRQIRHALRGRIRETPAVTAQILHAPFWQNLGMVEPGILSHCFVIAHADNPPFFYVKQPEFALGQTWVDLWVARSSEALGQFQKLGLPAIRIPYTIDPDLFFPIEDKKSLRREFGIPEDAYVIANFHRDTEGADLKTPKFQKAPELMVAILKRVRDAGVPFHVLLAGPRRHWIREALQHEGIPFTFVGKTGIAGDDFGKNILSRAKLNRLYNAADLHLVPSRWEGGPQSAMEAAACRIKQLCPPLGVARDILEPVSLFSSAAEAAQKIIDDAQRGILVETVEPQFQKWKASHTPATLAEGLQKLYERLPDDEVFQSKVAGARRNRLSDSFKQLAFTIRRRTSSPTPPRVIRWNHLAGRDADLDEILEWVRATLESWGTAFTNAADAEFEIAGWPIQDGHSSCRRLQFVAHRLPPDKILPGATLAVPAVQDLINLRQMEISNPAVVLPIPFRAAEGDSDWLVVAPDDRSASIPVWRAMVAGRAVRYPVGMAYSEQVFWGGLPYDGAQPWDAENPESFEFRSLAKIPHADTAREALRKLISI
jgi:glycosyltransferase involved in cell wall biosynthesis